jgi:Domain of unknown function (DUF6378)
MDRSETLDTAKQHVTKEREQQHGRPEDTFELIARLWSEYLDNHVSPTDVAMMMALLKIARQRGNPVHNDNYVDLAGYAACAAELAAPAAQDQQSAPEQPQQGQGPATYNHPSQVVQTAPQQDNRQQQYAPGGFH